MVTPVFYNSQTIEAIKKYSLPPLTPSEQLKNWRVFNYARGLLKKYNFSFKYSVKWRGMLSDKELKDAKAGLKAREVLIKSNQGAVLKLASFFAKGDTELLEYLVQIGNLGLIKGLNKYNPEEQKTLLSSKTKASFSSFVYFWIRGEILNYLAKQKKKVKCIYEEDLSLYPQEETTSVINRIMCCLSDQDVDLLIQESEKDLNQLSLFDFENQEKLRLVYNKINRIRNQIDV